MNAGNTSKINKNDTDATNIIDCSGNGTANITIGGGTGNGGGGGGGAEPTPSSLPRAGFMEYLAQFAVPGTLLFFIGLGIRFLFL